MILRTTNIPAAELVPLRFLERGQVAEIGEVLGNPDQVHRLHELGFMPGARVEMIQPGSPCIVRLADHRLCFRDNEMMGVLVRVGADV